MTQLNLQKSGAYIENVDHSAHPRSDQSLLGTFHSVGLALSWFISHSYATAALKVPMHWRGKGSCTFCAINKPWYNQIVKCKLYDIGLFSYIEN